MSRIRKHPTSNGEEMKPRMRMRGSVKIIGAAQAFTLIEILIVLTIIAVVVGILIPVVGKVRQSAGKAACAAQLASIGHAFQMYLNDSKGRLPRMNPLPLADPPAGEGPTVYEVFAPYLKDDGRHLAWRCPGDLEGVFERYGMSYEYNTFTNAMFGGRMMTDALAFARQPPMNLTPDKARIFNDFGTFHGKPGHRGNMNFLFADWHVGNLP
jgi:prepilin-type N-terminal cleavage/methylation domain-containing protein/prepilin-type processing-associated H-X9-DG protein